MMPLSIGPDEWDDFLCEPEDWLFQLDLLKRHVDMKTEPRAHRRVRSAASGRDHYIT